MILPFVLLLPLLGGVLAWLSEGISPRPQTALTAGGLIASLVLVLASGLWPEQFATDFRLDWVPAWGVSFHLRMDGLARVMVLLTLGLGLVAVLSRARPRAPANPSAEPRRAGLFNLALSATLVGVLGVFLAADLVLLYLSWELMLLPMFGLIAGFGHERRRRASFQFLVLSQLGGLCLLVGIVAVAWLAQSHTGQMSFDLQRLIEATPTSGLGRSARLGLMLCFFVAFAVKLPAVPLHVWLPDAHTEAPTAGSIVLAGLMLKTGAYGLIRVAIPLFPNASAQFAPVAVALGAGGVLYGALLAFGQSDLKRLVAFTSVSHMGFVLIGIYACTELSVQGAIMQMVSHGLTTAGLFLVVGMLADDLGTRDRQAMGGLGRVAPELSLLASLLALASLGLPSMGSFIGEFAVLAGAWSRFPAATAAASLGIVGAAVYALSMAQWTFWGRPRDERRPRLRRPLDLALLSALVAGLFVLGLRPQPLFDLTGPEVRRLVDGADAERRGAP